MSKKGTPPLTHVAVRLACTHVTVFAVSPPRPGQSVYCRRCRAYADVIENASLLKVRCRSCSYATVFAMESDDDYAAVLSDSRRAASRHSLRRDHTVDIKRSDGSIVETVSNDEGQGQLPFSASLTDRIEGNRAHQQSLRSLSDRNLPKA